MKILIILPILLMLAMLLLLNGCLPFIAGLYIGTQMAETHAHDEWCASHVGDVACHP
jgi:hypothetical protein